MTTNNSDYLDLNDSNANKLDSQQQQQQHLLQQQAMANQYSNSRTNIDQETNGLMMAVSVLGGGQNDATAIMNSNKPMGFDSPSNAPPPPTLYLSQQSLNEQQQQATKEAKTRKYTKPGGSKKRANVGTAKENSSGDGKRLKQEPVCYY